MRLQRGYMVQSQFDALNIHNSTSDLFVHTKVEKREEIIASDGVEHPAVPPTQDLPIARGRPPPIRSDTSMSASTIVAENGSVTSRSPKWIQVPSRLSDHGLVTQYPCLD